MIRVLLVEDSAIALTILKRMLADHPNIEVVGTASTGTEALDLIPQVKPDVICTDLHMPKMNGLEFIQEVMTTFPKPILVISAAVQKEDTENVFKLLKAGAVDVFPKPRAGLASHYEQAQRELITKIKILSGVAVFRQHRQAAGFAPRVPKRATSTSTITPPKATLSSSHPCRVVAIGSSTGGPQALHTILTQLPASFPVPILCVQHISTGFLQGLVDWLNNNCVLRVRIAQDGEIPLGGSVYFPPEGRHLSLDRQGRLMSTTEAPLGGHRPAVTVLFKAVARFYGRTAMGVLLTGMGRDGADGLLAIAQTGGMTIAQNEKSCVVFGMPKEAIALGAANQVLSLNQIAPTLLQKVLGK